MRIWPDPDLHLADLYHVGLVAHLPDLGHVPELLLHEGALEHDQHHEGEHRVVPVLVQAPQAHTEHLQTKQTVIYLCTL